MSLPAVGLGRSFLLLLGTGAQQKKGKTLSGYTVDRLFNAVFANHPGIKNVLEKYGQTAFNLYLFLTFGWWCAYQTYQTYLKGNLDYVEISFAVQNLILVALLLLRKPHRQVEKRLFNQFIAIIAFMSGAAFMGQDPTSDPTMMNISRIIVFSANILGILTLLNLGRSFGILIAFREVKTGYLYSIVRHPMYGTDILMRIGFFVSHCNYLTLMFLIISIGCYIYRAILEERFLSSQTEYKKYMQEVKYRFLPHIF